MLVTNEQAQAALNVLLVYIEQQPTEHAQGCGPGVVESTAVTEVRQWCHELLHYANACGYGGCRLCMG